MIFHIFSRFSAQLQTVYGKRFALEISIILYFSPSVIDLQVMVFWVIWYLAIFGSRSQEMDQHKN